MFGVLGKLVNVSLETLRNFMSSSLQGLVSKPETKFAFSEVHEQKRLFAYAKCCQHFRRASFTDVNICRQDSIILLYIFLGERIY